MQKKNILSAERLVLLLCATKENWLWTMQLSSEYCMCVKAKSFCEQQDHVICCEVALCQEEVQQDPLSRRRPLQGTFGVQGALPQCPSSFGFQQESQSSIRFQQERQGSCYFQQESFRFEQERQGSLCMPLCAQHLGSQDARSLFRH